MRFSLSFSIVLLCALLNIQAAQAKETRCGWFDNPTPSNAWLWDKDGRWIISLQGGFQAEGDWPAFDSNSYVSGPNGGYGFGCACFDVEVEREDIEQLKIVKIYSSRPVPLTVCKADKALPKMPI